MLWLPSMMGSRSGWHGIARMSNMETAALRGAPTRGAPLQRKRGTFFIPLASTAFAAVVASPAEADDQQQADAQTGSETWSASRAWRTLR